MQKKVNKSAHYLGRMGKQTSGTKNDEDTGGHQARSSSFLKMWVYIRDLPLTCRKQYRPRPCTALED